MVALGATLVALVCVFAVFFGLFGCALFVLHLCFLCFCGCLVLCFWGAGEPGIALDVGCRSLSVAGKDSQRAESCTRKRASD